jgi:hypothetical protein
LDTPIMLVLAQPAAQLGWSSWLAELFDSIGFRLIEMFLKVGSSSGNAKIREYFRIMGWFSQLKLGDKLKRQFGSLAITGFVGPCIVQTKNDPKSNWKQVTWYN